VLFLDYEDALTESLLQAKKVPSNAFHDTVAVPRADSQHVGIGQGMTSAHGATGNAGGGGIAALNNNGVLGSTGPLTAGLGSDRVGHMGAPGGNDKRPSSAHLKMDDGGWTTPNPHTPMVALRTVVPRRRNEIVPQVQSTPATNSLQSLITLGGLGKDGKGLAEVFVKTPGMAAALDKLDELLRPFGPEGSRNKDKHLPKKATAEIMRMPVIGN